jgi:hypothetical protein
MIEKLIERIQEYQRTHGTEYEPQIILLNLHGCNTCKSLETELMVDGWSYDVLDFMEDKHNEIADEVEAILETNSYPIITVTYPETKIICTNSPVRHEKLITNLNPTTTIYKQLIPHLS